MNIGQTVYTTFYSRTNAIATINGEVKKNGYMEDGRIIEEERISILYSDGSTEIVDTNHIVPFNKEEELPELYTLWGSEQIKFQKEEKELMSKNVNVIEMTVTFQGDNVPDLKRVFTGTRLVCETLRSELMKRLSNHGYSSLSSVG